MQGADPIPEKESITTMNGSENRVIYRGITCTEYRCVYYTLDADHCMGLIFRN